MNRWFLSAGLVLFVLGGTVSGGNDIAGDLFAESLGREVQTAPRDRDIGEIHDPADSPEIYATLRGFFVEGRDEFADPAFRRHMDTLQDDVTAVRMGKPEETGRFTKAALRVKFFDRSTRVITVLLRKESSAPEGWLIMDFS